MCVPKSRLKPFTAIIELYLDDDMIKLIICNLLQNITICNLHDHGCILFFYM